MTKFDDVDTLLVCSCIVRKLRVINIIHIDVSANYYMIWLWYTKMIDTFGLFVKCIFIFFIVRNIEDNTKCFKVREKHIPRDGGTYMY